MRALEGADLVRSLRERLNQMARRRDAELDAVLQQNGTVSEGASSRARIKAYPDPNLPERLGRFILQSRIGEGGMGVVYQAWDPRLGRTVAIKVLRSGSHDERARTRLFREARAMAQLNNPHLVSVYEIGEQKGRTFIAMEYVQGVTLDEWLSTPRRVCDIFEVFRQAAEGLQAAHDAGLLHRDFKPKNAMVGGSGQVKVLDFGIARQITAETSADVDADAGRRTNETRPGRNPGKRSGPKSARAGDFTFTQRDRLLGTPAYMAPEQLLQEPLTPATDQFAFAVSLYEGINHQLPFKGRAPLEIMTSILAGRITPWSDPSIPPGFRSAVEQALRPRPYERFPSMNALVRACLDGLGLQTQVPSLTARWLEHDRSDALLLRRALLPEARGLVSRPGLLTEQQYEFLEASIRIDRRRGLRRRAFLAAIVTALGGLSFALVGQRRREEALRIASQDEVRRKTQRLLRDVNSVVTQATDSLKMMNSQRRVWEPLFDAMCRIDEPDLKKRSAQLAQAIENLNAYFRPLIEGTPLASSIMVASDEGVEFLAFQDPDSKSFSAPYEFYNRFVQRPKYGKNAFQVFWEGNNGQAPRPAWLHSGGVDVRGTRWKGYVPEERVWFQNAAARPGLTTWTPPYLFFVTKDAGITGATAWKIGGRTRVLALDVTLMDLSLITTSLEGDDMVAMIVTRGGKVVGFPAHQKFPNQTRVREYLVARNAALSGTTDPSASLPTVAELGIPFLAEAYKLGKSIRVGETSRSKSLSTTYEFPYGGKMLWAGKAEVDQGALGSTIYVVQAPKTV